VWDDYSPIVTLEGDNTVMAQQAINFLIKQGRKALQGKDRSKVDGVFSYLNDIRELSSKRRCSASAPEHFLNLDIIEEALKVNICMKVSSLLKKAKNTSNDVSRKDFMNSLNALEVVDVSECHIRYVTFMFFKERLQILTNPNGKALMTKLCMLYGLDQLHKNNAGCYDSGYFHGQTKTPFSELVLEAIKELNR
jgi:acyl-CoA oxidase